MSFIPFVPLLCSERKLEFDARTLEWRERRDLFGAIHFSVAPGGAFGVLFWISSQGWRPGLPCFAPDGAWVSPG